VVDDQIRQLTWRNEVAVLRDRATLAVLREVPYRGEGWGLCYQPQNDRLVMSDGTAELTLRDPRTFAEIRRVTITLDGRPLDRLNELECAGSSVWANVWYRDDVVRIDLDKGMVTEVVHIGQLETAGVLNGVAALPGSDDLLVTGKNWAHLYRVRLDRTAGPSR
jgi:glutaminyl-peptide cyclotransferase